MACIDVLKTLQSISTGVANLELVSNPLFVQASVLIGSICAIFRPFQIFN